MATPVAVIRARTTHAATLRRIDALNLHRSVVLAHYRPDIPWHPPLVMSATVSYMARLSGILRRLWARHDAANDVIWAHYR